MTIVLVAHGLSTADNLTLIVLPRMTVGKELPAAHKNILKIGSHERFRCAFEKEFVVLP